MAVNKRSKTAEQNAVAYKTANRQASNRKRKLEKQLKLQPNNKNIPIALKSIVYRRKKPVNPIWSHSLIHIAKLFKEFGGKFDKSYLAEKPFIPESPKAKLGHPEFINKMKKDDWNFFSIRTALKAKGINV